MHWSVTQLIVTLTHQPWLQGSFSQDCDQLHVEDLIADDNGQDLTNYSFANDGFRAREGMNASRGGVDWQRKLSFRYRQIRENYKQHSLGNLKLVTDDQEAAYQRIIAEVQRLTNQWTEWVGRCLDIINNRSVLLLCFSNVECWMLNVEMQKELNKYHYHY